MRGRRQSRCGQLPDGPDPEEIRTNQICGMAAAGSCGLFGASSEVSVASPKLRVTCSAGKAVGAHGGSVACFQPGHSSQMAFASSEKTCCAADARSFFPFENQTRYVRLNAESVSAAST